MEIDGLLWLFILFALVNLSAWLKKVLTGGTPDTPPSEGEGTTPTGIGETLPHEFFPEDLRWGEEGLIWGYPEETAPLEGETFAEHQPLPPRMEVEQSSMEPEVTAPKEKPCYPLPTKTTISLSAVGPRLNPGEVLKGVIWSEILQPPRAQRPYQWYGRQK